MRSKRVSGNASRKCAGASSSPTKSTDCLGTAPSFLAAVLAAADGRLTLLEFQRYGFALHRTEGWLLALEALPGRLWCLQCVCECGIHLVCTVVVTRGFHGLGEAIHMCHPDLIGEWCKFGFDVQVFRVLVRTLTARDIGCVIVAAGLRPNRVDRTATLVQEWAAHVQT